MSFVGSEMIATATTRTRQRCMSGALSKDVAEADAWQALLQPWLDALKEAGLQFRVHTWTTVSDIENLWAAFRVRASVDNSDAAWLLRVEAMELLELLARVDRQLAWDLLINRTSSIGASWFRARHNEIPVAPRFQLIVDGSGVFTSDEDQVFKRLAEMKAMPTSHSAGYDDMKKTLLAKWSKKNGGRAFDREKEGLVEIALEVGLPCVTEVEEAMIDGAFAKLEQVVVAHRSGETVDRIVTPRGPLSLNSLVLSSGFMKPASNSMLSFIDRTNSMGMPTASVCLRKIDSDELDPTIWSGFLMNQVAAQQGSGVQELSFDMNEVDVDGIEALSLAMAHSRSLREIDAGSYSMDEGGQSDDDFDRWLWLTYALFSNESNHEIHTVTLNMELLDRVSCVEAMETVLSHDDPLAYLYEYLAAEEDEEDDIDVPSTASTVVLRPSAVVNRGYYNAAEQTHDPVSVEPNTAYRVVRNHPQDDCIEVVVPGRGTCWTHRSEVLEMKPVETRETHTVRHLNLHNVTFDGDPRAVIRFLGLIGDPIERLTLHDLRLGDETEDFFEMLLEFLPNLRRLDLITCRVQNLDFLYRNPTQLESLHFYDVGMRDGEYDQWERRDPESWEGLMAALSDPTHPLTLSLRELHIDFQRYANEDLRFGTPASVVEMLKHNKRLVRVELVDRKGSFDSPWIPDFLDHDGEPLPGRLGPLPPAETLAFLSVVSDSSSNSTSAKKPTSPRVKPARHKLNVESLRLILELAALTPRRLCVLL